MLEYVCMISLSDLTDLQFIETTDKTTHTLSNEEKPTRRNLWQPPPRGQWRKSARSALPPPHYILLNINHLQQIIQTNNSHTYYTLSKPTRLKRTRPCFLKSIDCVLRRVVPMGLHHISPFTKSDKTMAHPNSLQNATPNHVHLRKWNLRSLKPWVMR